MAGYSHADGVAVQNYLLKVVALSQHQVLFMAQLHKISDARCVLVNSEEDTLGKKPKPLQMHLRVQLEEV